MCQVKSELFKECGHYVLLSLTFCDLMRPLNPLECGYYDAYFIPG